MRHLDLEDDKEHAKRLRVKRVTLGIHSRPQNDTQHAKSDVDDWARKGKEDIGNLPTNILLEISKRETRLDKTCIYMTYTCIIYIIYIYICI